MAVRCHQNHLMITGHPENVKSNGCVMIIRNHMIKRFGINQHLPFSEHIGRTSKVCVMIHIRIKDAVGTVKLVKAFE